MEFLYKHSLPTVHVRALSASFQQLQSIITRAILVSILQDVCSIIRLRIISYNNNNNNNFINCKWVDTRWQWSFNMLHMYRLFALILVVGRGATREACSGNLEHKRELSQHLL